jgi:Photosynthetic reaction centre cytochrome C subunit
MRIPILFLLGVVGAGYAALAQPPSFGGVWKADLEKSKLGPQPPPSNYLVIIEQDGSKFNETTGAWTQRGEQRSRMTFNTDGKPTVVSYRGIPTRVTAVISGANKINLKEEAAGRDSVTTEDYLLSEDRQTLTVDVKSVDNGKERDSTLVLVKQPDSAGDFLRKPEEPASEHFKNVKTALRNLPASEFLDTMRYFSFSLGKDCEFCHVERKFDADDKKEKRTAREMIAMATGINETSFGGKQTVRCYTCHQGHHEPLRRPLFPDETAQAGKTE